MTHDANSHTNSKPNSNIDTKWADANASSNPNEYGNRTDVTVRPQPKWAEVKFWGVEGTEDFHHMDADECIRDYLEIYDNDIMPNSLTLVGVAPMVLRLEMVKHSALELLLDNLDELFGHPDADPTEPTLSMLEAEERFISAVIEQYKPSTCRVVTRKTIDVPEWLQIHEPSWLLGGVAMKAILEFNLPEEQEMYRMAMAGAQYQRVICDMFGWLRQRIKYDEGLTDEERKIFLNVREALDGFADENEVKNDF